MRVSLGTWPALLPEWPEGIVTAHLAQHNKHWRLSGRGIGGPLIEIHGDWVAHGEEERGNISRHPLESNWLAQVDFGGLMLRLIECSKEANYGVNDTTGFQPPQIVDPLMCKGGDTCPDGCNTMCHVMSRSWPRARASTVTAYGDRLPTVSASQALDELGDDASNHVSTGLEDLDHALLGAASVDSQETTQKGGVQRGQVTEIWGPPGTGKTALGLQLTANALCSGDAVVWVDCFQAVQHDRLKAVLETEKKSRKVNSPEGSNAQEVDGSDASRFYHYSCLTLPHFVALISRPTAKSIPANSSLVIISSLSALVNSALPKSHDGKAVSKLGKGPSPSTKRMQALQSIMNALHKLAATRNCAVVILSQCATKMHSERGATLTAAVNATVWEQGVSTRLVMFRDWVWQQNRLASVFLAGLQKVDGRASQETVENVVAFKVERVC
ncbi:hypothetical protein NM208_g13414 [Fusarium decemcellulare]|uniref:Uncharacterized protein n=1 Tax=Fusarium decemcellulare TaxID=57161 RepID=A0ACC1RKL1_9HYPO|nr:hypothetical protein NM208_g13414 [Fusarium decemcellulare]